MVSVVFNPNKFFSIKSKEKINLKTSFIIVLVYGILSLIPSLLLMTKITESLSSDTNFFAIASIAIGAISGLFIVFLVWFIISGVFYLLSHRFSSEGYFKRTVEFTGYGFIPAIFSSLIAILATYYLLPSIDFSVQNPQLLQQSLESIAGNQLLKFSKIIEIICVLLSANIWVFALSYSRNLSIKNAAIVVGAPTMFYILYKLYQLSSF